MTVRELCQIQGEKEMALVSYKCPNCGGSVVFDPKKQKFCCEFCMSEFTEESCGSEFNRDQRCAGWG